MEEFKPYNNLEAQEEAVKLRQKVESGEAPDYSSAEKIVDSEELIDKKIKFFDGLRDREFIDEWFEKALTYGEVKIKNKTLAGVYNSSHNLRLLKEHALKKGYLIGEFTKVDDVYSVARINEVEATKEGRDLLSQPTNSSEGKDESLKKRAEDVAKIYHLESSRHFMAKNLPELNKFFLAMLDEYVKKSGYTFSPGKEINIVDFGCGTMGYYDGYTTFFKKYGKTNNEQRGVGIICWESDQSILRSWADEMLSTASVHVGDETKDGVYQEIKKGLEGRASQKLDVVTMFAAGPGMSMTNPKEVDESFRQAISIFSELLNEGGVIILTTSFGGAKKEVVLGALKQSGLKILLCEPNEYEELLLEAHSGFNHEDVIIAVKEKEIKTEASL